MLGSKFRETLFRLQRAHSAEEARVWVYVAGRVAGGIDAGDIAHRTVDCRIGGFGTASIEGDGERIVVSKIPAPRVL